MTIEERAHSAYCGRTICTPKKKIHRFCVSCLYDGRKNAYIKGAEEQRKIDIDKARDFIMRNTTLDRWVNVDAIAEQLRKAMEE